MRISSASVSRSWVRTITAIGIDDRGDTIVQDEGRSKDGRRQYVAELHQLERKRIAPAVESFRTPEIDATELGGFALFYIARELEASKPGDALKAIAALKASHPDFPLMDEARLRYARILKAKGEREEAIRKLGSLTQSTDDAARGDALDELSNLFIGLGRFQDAVDVLETLY